MLSQASIASRQEAVLLGKHRTCREQICFFALASGDRCLELLYLGKRGIPPETSLMASTCSGDDRDGLENVPFYLSTLAEPCRKNTEQKT